MTHSPAKEFVPYDIWRNIFSSVVRKYWYKLKWGKMPCFSSLPLSLSIDCRGWRIKFMDGRLTDRCWCLSRMLLSLLLRQLLFFQLLLSFAYSRYLIQNIFRSIFHFRKFETLSGVGTSLIVLTLFHMVISQEFDRMRELREVFHLRNNKIS